MKHARAKEKLRVIFGSAQLKSDERFADLGINESIEFGQGMWRINGGVRRNDISSQEGYYSICTFL